MGLVAQAHTKSYSTWQLQIKVAPLNRLGFTWGNGTNVILPQGDLQPAPSQDWIQSGLNGPAALARIGLPD